jgi:hypothetical protein
VEVCSGPCRGRAGNWWAILGGLGGPTRFSCTIPPLWVTFLLLAVMTMGRNRRRGLGAGWRCNLLQE